MNYRATVFIAVYMAISACGTRPEQLAQTLVAQTATAGQAIEIEIATRMSATETAKPTNTLIPTSTTTPKFTPSHAPTSSATLLSTITPTHTPKVVFSPPRPTVSSPSKALLDSMRNLKKSVQLLANDNPDFITCNRDSAESVPNNFEAIINYPTYDVTQSSSVVQDAYNRYRQAISIIQTTNHDLYQNCVSWLAGTNTSSTIPFQTWGLARQGVSNALTVLEPGIAELESSPH